MTKMATRLRAVTTSGRSILLRVAYEGSHGGIGDTDKQAQECLAGEWSFLLWQFDVPEFQRSKP